MQSTLTSLGKKLHVCEATVCLFAPSRDWNSANPLRTHLGTGDQILNPCNSTKLMILSDLQQLKNQLLKLLLHFSATWKVVKTHLMSGTRFGGYKPPSPTILRDCNRCTLGVTMLPVPGVSKQQHGPDFQRYQCCSGAVQGAGGLDQNDLTDDNSDLEAGKENGKQQVEDRTCTGET